MIPINKRVDLNYHFYQLVCLFFAIYLFSLPFRQMMLKTLIKTFGRHFKSLQERLVLGRFVRSWTRCDICPTSGGICMSIDVLVKFKCSRHVK